MTGLKLSSNEIVIATNNQHKVKEIKDVLLGLLNVTLLTLEDIGLDIEIEEDGINIEENAYIKAKIIHELTGLPTLADDTGLEVEVLGNKPGVYSARYAGEGCNYVDNCNKILEEMNNKSHRNAVFKTIICFVDNMWIYYGEGRVDGQITKEFRGENGFGYDPIFEVRGVGKTYAEISDEEKNSLSHRSLALKDLKKNLGI